MDNFNDIMTDKMNEKSLETLNETQYEEIPPEPIPTMEEETTDNVSDNATQDTTYNTNQNTSYYNAQNNTQNAGDAFGYTEYSGGSEVRDADENIALTFAIISLVCGILSLIFCCAWCCNVPLSVIAIVFGIISINKSNKYKGLAIAGIICGGIAVSIAIILVILNGMTDFLMNSLDKLLNGVDIDVNEFF